MLPVLLDIVIETLQAFRRRAEGSTGGKVQLACINQVEHAVLDNLGVHGQILQVRLNEAADNSVSHSAYAGLERQQVLRHAASLHLIMEQMDEVLGHLPGVLINLAQRTNPVRNIARHDKLDLVRSAWDIRSTNPVIRLYNRNRQAVWRIQRNIYVVHALQLQRLAGIYLHDNHVSSLHIRSSIAHGSSRDNIAFLGDSASLNDSHIDLAAHVSVASQLSRLGQMQIAVVNLAAVDCISHILVGLVWHTELDAVCPCQSTIFLITGGSAGPEVNLEVLLFHAGCQCQRHSLRITGWSKTTGTNIHARLDESCCFLSSNDLSL